MKRTMSLLWFLVIVITLLQIARPIVNIPFSLELVVLLPSLFALVHGALRYRWSGILAFLVVCLVISNLFENISILTGFPFGHYYYSDGLGIKLFLVPILIGPAYFSTGYLAWTLGTIIVGDVHRKTSWFTTVAVPVIASFLMVAWDICLDPTASTIHQNWIWQQGGGYFGVPLSNYLGWFFVVYVFLQIFALFLRFRPDDAMREVTTLPRSYYAQGLIQYAMIGTGFLVAYAVNHNDTLVTDAAGVVWHTASISETQAIMSILRNFLLFWYDFIVGDAWELAAGVVIALVLSAALAPTVLQNITWLLLPITICLALTGSLVWYARKQQS